MAPPTEPAPLPLQPAPQEGLRSPGGFPSLDWLSVLVAIVLAIGVRLGMKIPW